MDYASNLNPMSELVEGQYCTVSAAAFPEEREVAATEQPQPTAAAEPTPEETPVQSPLRTEAPIPTEVPQDSTSAGSFWLWSLAGAVVVAAAVVLVIVYIKNKKKRGNGQ